MKLRHAVEGDAADLLAWRNDPHTVAMSRRSEPVAEDEHYRWFQKALIDEDRVFFVAVDGTRKVGVIRFDRNGEAWDVSINVKPGERGRGVGSRMLKSGISKLGDCVGATPLTADIKPENVASIRLFEKCGFQRVGESDGLLHFRRS